MLTAFCVAVGALCAGPDLEQPVSADAAVWRSQLEAAISPEHPDAFDELFAMPMARVNGTPILAGDLLLRYRRQLIVAERRATGIGNCKDPIRDLIIRELPEAIDQELLWPAAQREFGNERFAEYVALAEYLFDNHKVPKLAAEFAGTGDPAAALAELHITLADVRRSHVRAQIVKEYLKLRAASPEEAAAFMAAKRQAAVIQTAFELPAR